MTYKRLTFYGIVDGTFGHNINNQGEGWGLLDMNSHYFDQADNTVETAKPVGYSWRVGGAEGAGTVLVVDGIFLHRPELKNLWHWSVWLEVPESVACARMAIRDGSDPDPAAPSNARYRLGQELYLREARPQLAASAIVDNSDLAHPRREYRDFC